MQWKHFESIILFLIVASSIKLAFDTYLVDVPVTEDDEKLKLASNILDYIFTVAFTLEAVFKIIAYGFIVEDLTYLRDTWN